MYAYRRQIKPEKAFFFIVFRDSENHIGLLVSNRVIILSILFLQIIASAGKPKARKRRARLFFRVSFRIIHRCRQIQLGKRARPILPNFGLVLSY